MSAYYSGVIALTVVAMLVMVVTVLRSKVLSPTRKRAFALTFLLIALLAIAEWLGVFCQATEGTARWMHVLSKTLELSVTPFLTLLFAYCFEGRASKAGKVLGVLFALHVLLEIASGIIGKPGLAFYVDANDVYHRSTLYLVYVVCDAVGLIFFFTRAVLLSHSYQNRNLPTLLMCAAVIFAGVVVQFFSPEVRITWITIAITAIILFIYLKELVLQVDPVTKILNRLTFDNHINGLRKPALLIAFDVNKFKLVNDTYGHSFGDQCLLTVAQTMKEVYGHAGLCFRTGGDEFAVLLERMIDSADELERQFHAKLDAVRATEPRMPYVAVGTALYRPGEDSVEGAIIRADQMMYEQKNAYSKR